MISIPIIVAFLITASPFVCHGSSFFILLVNCCPLNNTLIFPWPVCVCVCVFLSCYLHPTSSLPCFPCHSLFLWIDMFGKITQTETSHLYSQINFCQPLKEQYIFLIYKHILYFLLVPIWNTQISLSSCINCSFDRLKHLNKHNSVEALAEQRRSGLSTFRAWRSS